MTCSEAFKDELYLVENVHFVFIINPSPTVQSSFFPTTCFPFFWHVFIVSRYLTKGHHNSSILNKFILDNIPGILMILPGCHACHSELNIIICSVRKLIHWFVCAPAFDKFIMIVICFASFCIAAEDPVDEANPRNYYLSKADYVFTITFACEVCLKVIVSLS